MWTRIKDKLKRGWKWFTALFVGGIVIAQIAGFPPTEIEVPLTWKYSFETPVFNTKDGNIHLGEYANYYGGYLIYRAQNNRYEKVKNLDPTGLTEIFVVGSKGVDVFEDPDTREIKEYETTLEKYRELGGNSKAVKTIIKQTTFWDLFKIQNAYAAISRHAGYTHQFCAGCTSITYAYDAGSDPDRVLIVSVYQDGTKGIPTYNSVSLTDLDWTPGFSCFAEIYALNDPASGSNNIVVSNTGGGATEINVVSYDGADITQSYNSSGSGSSGSATLTVTTAINNSYVLTDDRNFDGGGAGGITATSGTQLLANKSDTGGCWQGFSDIQKVTAGAQVMTWTNTDANYDMFGIEVTEVSAGGGGKPRRIIIE